MPTDTDSTTEQDPIEPIDPAPTGSTTRRSILRAVRRLATPVSIVVAWIVVVTQWNQSDTALFNWATITAGIVLGIVTVLWLVSLKFPALRRALLPFEGGLVVAAVVLAWATGGREVDMLGDRIAIAFAFGVIAALLLAFMQQLVAGRDRASAWMTGVVVVCALAGIAVPATLDWLDSTADMVPYDSAYAGEIVGRSSTDGFRLDDVSLLYDAPTLAGGYNDEAAAALYGVGYATPVEAVGFTESVDPAAGVAYATPAPMPGMIEGGSSVPTVRNDWGRLLAQPDGAIKLVVQPGIATGVTGAIIGSLRRGDCSNANGKELLSVKLGRSGDRIERTLPMQVEDLRIDDRISFVIGTAEPLAPTRCIQLLSGAGIAMAQLGAASFNDECLEPLDLPRGSEYLVRPSTFQDTTCATRFDELSQLSASLLVPSDNVDGFRDCRRTQEPGIVATERRLPKGAIAVTYPDHVFGQCVMYGVNALTYGSFGATGGAVVDPNAASPVPSDVEGPIAGASPTGPAVTTAPPAGAASAGAAPAAPGGSAAPAAPVLVDPATGEVVSEDLDGLTHEELGEKIR